MATDGRCRLIGHVNNLVPMATYRWGHEWTSPVTISQKLKILAECLGQHFLFLLCNLIEWLPAVNNGDASLLPVQ